MPHLPEPTTQHRLLPSYEHKLHSQRHLADRMTFRDRFWLLVVPDQILPGNLEKCELKELSPEPCRQSHTPTAAPCRKRVERERAHHNKLQSQILVSDDPFPCNPSRKPVHTKSLLSLKTALPPALLPLNRWTTLKIQQ